jgi:GTP cyclohydrolase II
MTLAVEHWPELELRSIGGTADYRNFMIAGEILGQLGQQDARRIGVRPERSIHE